MYVPSTVKEAAALTKTCRSHEVRLCQRHKAQEEKVLNTGNRLSWTHTCCNRQNLSAATDTNFQTDVNIQQPLLTVRAAGHSHTGPCKQWAKGHNAPADHNNSCITCPNNAPSAMRSPQQGTQDGTTGRTTITTAALTNAMRSNPYPTPVLR